MRRPGQETEDSGAGGGPEERLGRATALMQELSQLQDSPADRLVARRLVQITAELEDVRDLLLTSVQPRLSPRQLAVLLADSASPETELDPSVRFFGVEWDVVFGRCFGLGLNIRIFQQRLAAGSVDTLGLAAILAELAAVERLMEQHGLALQSGSLSSEQLSRQLDRQVRVSQLGQAARANTPQGENTQRKIKKYKKNKTDNLTNKMSNTMETSGNERRNSTVEFVPKKKLSFMAKVSGLLDYV